MDAYADLKPLGITSEELWELRNGLLHMTNLDSRAVNKNKVRRISFHVGANPLLRARWNSLLWFYELLMEVARAHVRWLETYNSNPEKRVEFVSRYDQTISDSRVAPVRVGAASARPSDRLIPQGHVNRRFGLHSPSFPADAYRPRRMSTRPSPTVDAFRIGRVLPPKGVAYAAAAARKNASHIGFFAGLTPLSG